VQSPKDKEKKLPTLLYSDIVRMIKSIKHDFPDFITLSTIGKSYQDRDINLMVVDARDYLLKQKNVKNKDNSFA